MPSDAWPSRRRAWTALLLLNLVVLLAGIDRSIISLLIDPIRHDLGISDTQVSLVAGAAFGFFYSVLALPLGRMADYKNRVNLLAAAVLFWSIMTALAGAAKSFWHLLFARMGVGAGEAALFPCAGALLADIFPPPKLPLALGCFVAAGLFGASFAFIAGGWAVQAAVGMGVLDLPVVGTVKPWQTAFVLVGAPGLLISALVLLIREPARKGRMSGATAGRPLPLRAVLAFAARRKRLMILHNLGFGFAGLYTFALFLWAPTFLSRTYGWSVAEAGSRFGLAIMATGVPCIYLGGWLVTVLMKRGIADAALRVAFIGLLLLIPVSIAAPLMPTGDSAVAMFALAMALFSVPAAVPQSSLQLITPNEIRGQASALYAMAANTIGLSCGPTLVALLNDYVFRDSQAIGLSLSIVCGGSVAVSCLLIGLARRPYARAVDLALRGIYDEALDSPK